MSHILESTWDAHESALGQGETMQTIRIETRIAAPVERCFLLSLSMDLHTESTAQTKEQAVVGVTHGIIGPGETVTFEGHLFGFKLRHTSVISAYPGPDYFQDSMTKGMFKSFVHDHHFAAADGGTLMRDELRFAAPVGVLGRVAEVLMLRRHLAGFLMERNTLIKTVAESEAWRRFIAEDVYGGQYVYAAGFDRDSGTGGAVFSLIDEH